jgi:hypothetical protein
MLKNIDLKIAISKDNQGLAWIRLQLRRGV